MDSIPIQEPFIDSLSIALPFDQIEIIDSRLGALKQTVYTETGLLENDEKVNSKIVIVNPNGITTRYERKELQYGNERKTVLNITLSAKLLKGRYFEGININNIHGIYKTYMRMRIVRFSFVSFMNARPSDIDITRNFRNDVETFDSILDTIIKNLLPGKAVHLNDKFLSKDNNGNLLNLGIELSKREKARPSHPHIILYFKQIELLTKSRAFYLKFLEKNYPRKVIKNLARIEYTIKGSKHFDRLINMGLLKEKPITLVELLNIETYLFGYIINSGIMDYIRNPFGNVVKTLKELSPTDRVQLNFMSKLIQYGESEQTILQALEDFDIHNSSEKIAKSEAQAKSRQKKRINYLYDLLIIESPAIKHIADKNAEVNKFFMDIVKPLVIEKKSGIDEEITLLPKSNLGFYYLNMQKKYITLSNGTKLSRTIKNLNRTLLKL